MSSEDRLSGKETAQLFFHKESPVGNTWICRCGKQCLQKGTGYTNLVNHVMRYHDDQVQQIKQQKKSHTSINIMQSFWSPKTQRLHAWLTMIIEGLLPFSFCENERARQFMKHGSVSRNTLTKYMNKLMSVVETKISLKLPDKFALVFDGWSACDSNHFMAVFATYVDESATVGYAKVLLTIAPLGEGVSFTAKDHYDFVTYVLNVYHKTWENVVCLVGDNCNTNKALATIAKRPLVGCASHRFNLAVKDVLKDYHDVLSKINSIMKKLKNLIPSAKLRKLTPLRPKGVQCYQMEFDI